MDNKLIGNENNIIFYNDEEGQTRIEVILQNENVWLNIESLTKLFKIDRTGITRHINNIYKDEELNENYYLNNNTVYLGISPAAWGITGDFASNHVMSSGSIELYVGFYKLGVRPVINLASYVEITSGDGTIDNPYVVK